MKRALMAVAVVAAVAAGAAAFAYQGTFAQKLPKCTKNLCRDSGCSPEVLCVAGAHVRNCADVCGN